MLFGIRNILNCLIFILTISFVKAQNPISKNYKIEDGLLSNECHFAYPDSKGYMWIATDAGLCKYNGYSFKYFTTENGLPENLILRIYEDRKGRIWFITLSSKIGYIKNDSICNINFKFKQPIDGKLDNFAYSLYVDKKDTLWVGTIYSGLLFKLPYPYSGVPTKKELNSQFIIEFEPEGECVFGTFEGNQKNNIQDSMIQKTFMQMQLWNGKSTRVNINTKKTGFSLKQLIKISDDKILIQALNSIYIIKKGKLIKVKEFTENISFLTKDEKGDLWVGVFNQGLFQFKLGKEITFHKHYLKNITPTHIAYDYEGGFWVTTLFNGIFHFPDLEYLTLINSDIGINNIFKHKNEIMINETNGDLIILKNDSIKPERHKISATAFIPFQNNVYLYNISNTETQFDLNKKKLTYIKVHSTKSNLLKPKFKYFYKHNNSLYGGNTFSIYHYDSSTNCFNEIVNLKSRINSFLVDNNEILWMATNDGLYSYDQRGEKLRMLGDSIPSLSYRFDKIILDKNNFVWVTSKGKGVFCYKGNGKVENYNVDCGLNSNFIQTIYCDDENNIWLASSVGLSKIVSKQKLSVTNYHFLNGYGIGNVNNMLIDSNYLFFTTSNGLYKLPYSSVISKFNTHKIPLYITNVKAGSLLNLKPNSTLDYSNNSLRFDFESVSYSHAFDYNYNYRIEGFSSNWNTTKDNHVELLNLPPGDYKFIVRIVSEKSNKILAYDSFQFSISYPFWKSYWFYGICLLGTGLLIFFIIKLRVSTVRKKERLLSDMKISVAKFEAKAMRAQMNPHFIFNSLNSIQSFITREEKEKAGFYLGKFSKLMRNVLEQSFTENVTLAYELDILKSYIELEQMRCNYSFDYNIDISDEINPSTFKIPSMLLQPYVENAIVHGLSALQNKKGKLNISFTSQNTNTLVCTIEDNGIGRVAAQAIKEKKESFHQSMGLSITNERFDFIKKSENNSAKVIIEDLYQSDSLPNGTRIEIYLPIKFE
jgi:ligand-binding sensor domain-containing protein